MPFGLEAGTEPFPGLRLVQLLGRGGFAEVWEAVDSTNRQLALKFMASKNSGASGNEVRIIQTIRKLRHPNLIAIDQVWCIPDYIVVAMELADGSLLDVLDVYQEEYKQSLPQDLVLLYVTQAAKALDFLAAQQHQLDGRGAGFQHRDVKPSNLLVVGDRVKLADFGLARVLIGDHGQCDKCGTPDFTAPEVYRGLMTDRTDQYSLALTYFHLRTGSFPFPPAPTRFDREYSFNRPAADLSLLRKHERPAVERALEMEPSLRWPSCAAFVGALSKAFRELAKSSTMSALGTDLLKPIMQRARGRNNSTSNH